MYAAEPDVGVGGADRAVQGNDGGGFAADVDRPLHLRSSSGLLHRAADELERQVGLAAAGPLGWPDADDVGDRLDQVLEVLALGLIVGGEVKLIERVAARAPVAGAARDQGCGDGGDEEHAGRDFEADDDQE